jgi:alpha-D-ribose 1-methylphosphonate 5-triphosphate diphosphatase
MKLQIVNANIVLPDEVARGECLTVEDGMVSRVGRMGRGISGGQTINVIDARGAYLLPGLIDIHSDHVEQAIEPRPGSVMDVAYALQEQEKQLVNHGITMIYHSLSVRKPLASGERRKAAREDGFFLKIIDEIENLRHKPHLISHKIHIRFDLTNIEGIPLLTDMLNGGQISLLSFMDHTPGQGQYRDVERFAETIKAHSPELSDKDVVELLDRRMNPERIPRAKLAEIAAQAKANGISVASHDDDSMEKVDFMRNTLGAAISEFPVEMEVARYAKAQGMATLGGAPNVLIGKSHSGNMPAIDGILDGCVTMLSSDYYPPALLQAVFKLHRAYGIPLNECVKLVTLAPAEAVGVAGETGSIGEGKAADLILVDASCEYPRLVTAITDGKVASTLHYEGPQQAIRRVS